MLVRPPACAVSNIQSLISPEPLLFLYPRWFQQQCRASARAFRTGKPLSTGHRTSATPAGQLASSTRPERQPAAPTAPQNDSDQPSQTFDQHELASHVEKPSAPARPTRYSASSRISRRVRKVVPLDSPGVRRLVQRKAVTFKDRQSWGQPAHMDLHQILRHLAAASENDSDQPPNHETLELPTELLKHIAGTVTAKPNMWIHHAGSGCAVHVLPAAPATPDLRHVELIGSSVSIAATRDYLLRYKTTNQPEPPPRAWRPNWDQVLHVHDIARPPQWSIKSFYHYVLDVLSNEPRKMQRNSIYNPDESYPEVASRTLQSLFSPANDSSAYASVAALRLVLQFHRRHPELHRAVSSFWHTAITLGLAPDVHCYNQELARLISLQNINAAIQLLFDMQKANVSPNADTWRLVLSRSEYGRAQQISLGALRMLGLLDTPKEQAKASTTLARKVGPYFDVQLDDIDDLVGYMEHHIGSDWLSTSVLNRLLRTCLIGRKGARYKSAMAIVSKLHQSANGESLMDAHTVSLLVLILTKAGFLEDAFALLESFHLQHTRKHDPQIIPALFNLALRRKYLNSCRVLWCYAANTAITTWPMRKKMQGLLQFSDTKYESDVWKQRAASFIVGNEMDTSHFERVFPLLFPSSSSIDVRAVLSTFEPDADRYLEKVELVRLLLRRDLHMWRFYWPIPWLEFRERLRKAIQMDKDQLEQDTISEPTNSELISVPLIKREVPIRDRSFDSKTHEDTSWLVINGHKFDGQSLSLAGVSAEPSATCVTTGENLDGQIVGQANQTDSGASREVLNAQQRGSDSDTAARCAAAEAQATHVKGEVRQLRPELFDLNR